MPGRLACSGDMQLSQNIRFNIYMDVQVFDFGFRSIQDSPYWGRRWPSATGNAFGLGPLISKKKLRAITTDNACDMSRDTSFLFDHVNAYLDAKILDIQGRCMLHVLKLPIKDCFK